MSVAVGEGRADDEIGEAVAIDGAVEGGKGAIGTDASGVAGHHGARPGVRRGIGRADDHAGEAVAIDVAGRGDREAGVIVLRFTADPEAVAAVERGQVEAWAEPRGV